MNAIKKKYYEALAKKTDILKLFFLLWRVLAFLAAKYERQTPVSIRSVGRTCKKTDILKLFFCFGGFPFLAGKTLIGRPIFYFIGQPT